jgi:N-ethylmaleimide reductase
LRCATHNGFTPERAVEAVRSDRVDLVSFGRPFLSNPDFVERVRSGGPFVEQAPKETWYGGGRKGHAD